MADNVAKLALTPVSALRTIRDLAADSFNIVVLPGHGRMRQRQRRVSHAQVVKCVRLGSIQEGPFLNNHGNWQVTMYRHSAGEELTCVVVIEPPTKLLVVTVIPGR